MSIKLIRLITGEFLMADIEAENGDTMQLRDAVILLVGKENVGFTHLNPFGNDPENTTVNQVHVLFTAEPAEDLLAEYNRIFSRIQIAPANTLQ